jgi:5-formyltetrahydrofolate cyclo-ligase
LHKAALRQHLLPKRMAMPTSEWHDKSHHLVAQLLSWLKGRSFEAYVLYRSFRREPDLDALARILPMEATYYPRLRGQEMDFYATEGSFELNRFGIEEPKADPDRLLNAMGPSTLLIIPAVAYDLRGFRLGYGGGFFDRFLASHQLTTLGVCFDAFLLDELPTESHDQPVQTVVTESRVIQ